MTALAEGVGDQGVKASLAPTNRRLPRSTKIALAVLAVYAVTAVVTVWVNVHNPNAQDLANRLLSPSLSHPLGTDQFGRDVFARCLAASRVDMLVGVLGAALPCLVGLILGTCGGYRGGVVDTIIMRLSDLVFAFPIYLFIIALVAAIGPGVRSILLAFTFVGWIPYARLVRTEILRVKSEDYVTAAYLGAVGRWRVLLSYVLRNSLAPVVTYVVIDVMFAILTLASFSYLGLGIQPPTAEWGAMIADGQTYLQTNWWLTLGPGVFVAVLGFSLIILGEQVSERRDG